MKTNEDLQARIDPQIEIGGETRRRSEWEVVLKTWRNQLAHFQKLANERKKALDEIAAILARSTSDERVTTSE